MRIYRAVGVLAVEKDDDIAFLGTTAAFRDGAHYLTASHCVPPDIPAQPSPGSGLTVSLASGAGPTGFMGRVRSVARHPEADLAVLTVEGDPPGSIEGAADPFLSVGMAGRVMAEEFVAFGYPMGDSPTPSFRRPGPIPRTFVGHYQRIFPYERGVHRFAAAELSITAPEGLSGGPVFNRERPQEIHGLVVENMESRTERNWEESIDEDGHKRSHASYSIISYGIAVLLDPLRGWLDEQVQVTPPGSD
jgi:hypothetical protein